MRWPFRMESGSSLSKKSVSRGLIEEINLRRRAVHVQINEVLRLGREVWQPGQGGMHLTGRRRGGSQGPLAKELGQCNAAHLQAGALEELPSVL